MADNPTPAQNIKYKYKKKNKHRSKNKGNSFATQMNSDVGQKIQQEGVSFQEEDEQRNQIKKLFLNGDPTNSQPHQVMEEEASPKPNSKSVKMHQKFLTDKTKANGLKEETNIDMKGQNVTGSVVGNNETIEKAGYHDSGPVKGHETNKSTEPVASKAVLKKQELEQRLTKWKQFFQNAKHWLLIFDYHNVHVLRTVRDKTPRAQCVCKVCSYYCDNLDIVMSHIKDPRHLTKLNNSLMVSTTVRVPPAPKKICDILSDTLEKFIAKHVMTSYDIKQRSDFVRILNNFVSEKLPGCGVRMYGSSLHGMGLQSSDLNIDLVVDSNLNGPTALALLGGLLERELPICKEVTRQFSADVDIPHLKFFLETGPGKVVECAISLNNENPFKLAVLLQKYSSMDNRARDLCALFRIWGKMCCVDKQAEGTWPGYSFYLLVIFFLQQINMLPVLHEFTADGENTAPENYADPSELQGKWKCSSSDNLGTLWLQMLQFYSVDFDCAQRLVSIQQSSPLLRKQKSWGGKRIAIVDPFLPKRNITRSVCHDATYEYIITCLQTTYLYYAIPQTAEGPIFGQVRPDIQIDDFGLADIQSYIKKQKFLESFIVKLIITTDLNYPGNTGGTNVTDILKLLHNDNFLNLNNLDLSPFWTFRNEKQKPFRNKYKDLIICASDAVLLMSCIDPRVVVYQFNPFRFTSGKMVPLSCAICQKEGHTKAKCPEEVLTELEQLPPLRTETITHLNKLCEIVFEWSVPSVVEDMLRLVIVKELEDIIVALHPGAKLTLFGSSCNGFGLKGSDLDICLTFTGNESGEGLDTPRFIENLCADLRKQSKFQRLVSIPSAKVPIIKFVHRPSMLEGDISLYNTLALENTKLLRTYSSIDKRAKALGYMIKRFAKLCNIGYASKGSLSSYSYTLMAIFFLQRCNPPVLPVLQELTDNPDGSTPINIVDGFNTYFYSNLKTLGLVWPHFGRNTKSVGELWIELLRFYTEEFDLINSVICIRSSKPLSKFTKLWVSKCIAIEDPFDLNHNLGSGLSRKMNIYIIKAFRKGRLHFSLPMNIVPSSDFSFMSYYFDPKVLADMEPPNDRGCHFCKNIGHKSHNCPEKPNKHKVKELKKTVAQMKERSESMKKAGNVPVSFSRTFFPTRINSHNYMKSSEFENGALLSSPLRMVPPQSVVRHGHSTLIQSIQNQNFNNLPPYQPPSANNCSTRFGTSKLPPGFSALPSHKKHGHQLPSQEELEQRKK